MVNIVASANIFAFNAGLSPPLLSRDGPSKDYLQFARGNPSNYQDSRGHLRTGSGNVQGRGAQQEQNTQGRAR